MGNSMGVGGSFSQQGKSLSASERAAEKEKLAAKMRESPTPAEARLWRRLKDQQVMGMKFRRQVVLWGYIADFYCEQLRLVVEVDGGYHRRPQQREYDRKRDEHLLTNDGIRTLRITNKQTERKKIKWAVEAIKTEVMRRAPWLAKGSGTTSAAAPAKVVEVKAGSPGLLASVESHRNPRKAWSGAQNSPPPPKPRDKQGKKFVYRPGEVVKPKPRLEHYGPPKPLAVPPGTGLPSHVWFRVKGKVPPMLTGAPSSPTLPCATPPARPHYPESPN